MKAIVQFENHPNVAKRFKAKNIDPKLVALNENAEYIFVDYVDNNSPGAQILSPHVAARAAVVQLEERAPDSEKTVFVIDLDAEGASSPDSSYGLCILLNLADSLGISVIDLLGHKSFLVTILTLFPEELFEDHGVSGLLTNHCDLTVLDSAWPRITRIRNEHPSQVTDGERGRVALALQSRNPKLILANAGIDNEWLGDVIVDWLTQS